MPPAEPGADPGSLQDFADLAESLAWQRDREVREILIADYCARTPDPHRAMAIALLARHLVPPRIAASRLREGLAGRLDPSLLPLVDAHVGEPLESLALLWPERSDGGRESPMLAGAIEALASKNDVAARLPVIAGLLDRLEPGGRRILLDLLAGRRAAPLPVEELRAGLCRHGGLGTAALDELWPEQAPPYATLLAWLDGAGPAPEPATAGYRRPMPVVELADPAALPADLEDGFAAEWLWTGRRVQLVGDGRHLRLFDTEGEDISAKAPELIDERPWIGNAEGVLQALEDGRPAPPDILRRRLGRRAPTRAQRRSHPLHLVLFDLLADDDRDLRPLPWSQRRPRLEQRWPVFMGLPVALSPLLSVASGADLPVRMAARPAGSEGLIFKRRTAPYGDETGDPGWLVCRPAPERLKAMLLYARRSTAHPGLYADPTVGLRDGDGFVTLGASDWELSAEQARLIDQWVRANTTRRYGPVRDVAPGLLLEIGFRRREPSPRHGAGWLVRAPKVLAVHVSATMEETDPSARLIPVDTDKT